MKVNNATPSFNNVIVAKYSNIIVLTAGNKTKPE